MSPRPSFGSRLVDALSLYASSPGSFNFTKDDEEPGGFASGLEGALSTYGRIQGAKKARTEEQYQSDRRARIDPLEEALLQGRAREQGIVPAGEGEDDYGAVDPGFAGQVPPPGDLASAIEGGGRGADLMSGRAKFGDQGLQPPQDGINAPGSFNPLSGRFNPATIPGQDMPGQRRPAENGLPPARGQAPRGGRVPISPGYEFDPALTERGRKEAQDQEAIAALEARGVPHEEAVLEVRASLGNAIKEHFHPGPWHPTTQAEADSVATTKHRRELELARVRATAGRGPVEDKALKERRDGWMQQLGRPRTVTDQYVLDFLADGVAPENVAAYFPPSQHARVEEYLSGKFADVNERRYQTQGLFPNP